MRFTPLKFSFCACVLVSLLGAAEPSLLDEVTMPNGELARGHYVGREGDEIIFESASFGRLRLKASQVRLTLAQTTLPPGPALAAQPVAATAVAVSPGMSPPPTGGEAEDEAEFVRKSWIRRLLPTWGGSIRLSEEFRRDSNVKSNFLTELHLHRDTEKNVLKLNASYEYNSENEKNTVDVSKADVYWRHHLTPRWFTVYAPTAEYNRTFETHGLHIDYLLTRQELGAGWVALNRKKYQVRLGLAENYFYVWFWNSGNQYQAHEWVESAFIENDMRLPFGMRLVQRGTWYFSPDGSESGWESDLDLTKRLTETFNITLRQEIRKNVPGVQSSNYNLWRIVFGIDF